MWAGGVTGCTGGGAGAGTPPRDHRGALCPAPRRTWRPSVPVAPTTRIEFLGTGVPPLALAASAAAAWHRGATACLLPAGRNGRHGSGENERRRGLQQLMICCVQAGGGRLHASTGAVGVAAAGAAGARLPHGPPAPPLRTRIGHVHPGRGPTSPANSLRSAAWNACRASSRLPATLLLPGAAGSRCLLLGRAAVAGPAAWQAHTDILPGSPLQAGGASLQLRSLDHNAPGQRGVRRNVALAAWA